MSDPALRKSEPDLLDVPEAANLLRLKQSTVRAWMLDKRLPYIKLGRRVFIQRCDLLDLISRSLVPVKGPMPRLAAHMDGAQAAKGLA